MLESSADPSVVDQCVACCSKFTSAERPLKLLPCLHSMCLDCLYGRATTPSAVKPVEAIKDPSLKDDIVLKDVDNSKVNNGNDSKSDSTSVTGNDDIKNTHDSSNQESATEGRSENSEKEIEIESETTTDNKSKSSESQESKDSSADDKTSKDESKPVSEGSEKAAKSVENVDEKMEESNDGSAPGEVAVDNSQSEKDNTIPPTANDGTENKVADVPEAEKQAEVIKTKPAKECPVCHDAIAQVPTNLMDNMFATLDQQQASNSPDANSSHACTACEEGQQADSFCMQCDEWLCDSCVDAHKRVRVTKDHTISPKDQVSSTCTRSPWEQQMMCKQHRQEQLKFFCEKCEAMTCRDCQLMDHKEHKYQFLDQAADQYKARLKGSLALMGEKRSKLATSRDEIEQKLLNCKEQKDTVQAEILRQADILVKRIRTAVWGVLSNLASFTDAATKRLNKEIEDVSDLMGKFDHCIMFMEEILKHGTSMSLLYSKGNVEAKCRKVYHTQVDPQSLKGNLMIQYKHDVNWLLNNLNKIGAIFVNGVRYPPEKLGGGSSGGGGGGSSGQNQRHHHNTSPSSAYSQQDPRGQGVGATSPHLQHMANQAVPGQRGGPGGGDEWSKFIQNVSTKPGVAGQINQSAGPPNISVAGMQQSSNNSLPPQLTLPNRRTSNTVMGGGGGHGWAGSNFSGHFPPGGPPPMAQQQQQQLLQQQQQQQQPQHQHMGQPTKPVFTPMRLHHRPAASHGFSNNQSESHKGNMRSPPSYRGEASGSNINSSSRSTHGTPDPARPASAGMYDGGISRPDSGGGPAMIDIKKERRDQSPDCVITSAGLRTEKQNPFQTSPMASRVSETVLEMQKNLDDVIRAVPMDLSENLEQISGAKPLPEEAASRPKLTASPLASLNVNLNPVVELSKSPTDEELRENWQGGNSMPGFSIPTVLQADPNDDYCACCHNGGDVLCCDTCPRVFHLQCHIPEIPSVPSGSFVCTICEGDKPVEHEEFNANGKRLVPLPEQDLKVCKRILLELFCHPSSIPFHEPVNKEQVPNYYKIITQPKDFTLIKSRLEKKDNNVYLSVKGVKGFLYDLRQVFINCHIYNKKTSEVGKAGLMVRECFEAMVSRLMPQYQEFVKENPSPCFSAVMEVPDSVVNAAAAAAGGGGDGSGGGSVSNGVMSAGGKRSIDGSGGGGGGDGGEDVAKRAKLGEGDVGE